MLSTILSIIGVLAILIGVSFMSHFAWLYAKSLINRAKRAWRYLVIGWALADGKTLEPPTQLVYLVDPELLEKVRGSNIQVSHEKDDFWLVHIETSDSKEVYRMSNAKPEAFIKIMNNWQAVNVLDVTSRIKEVASMLPLGPDVGSEQHEPKKKKVKGASKPTPSNGKVKYHKEDGSSHWKTKGPNGEPMRGPNQETPPDKSPMPWTGDFGFIPYWDEQYNDFGWKRLPRKQAGQYFRK